MIISQFTISVYIQHPFINLFLFYVFFYYFNFSFSLLVSVSSQIKNTNKR